RLRPRPSRRTCERCPWRGSRRRGCRWRWIGEGVGLLRAENVGAGLDGGRDGRAAGRLRGVHLRGYAAVEQAQLIEFVEALVDLTDERAAGAGHDDMVRRAPAQLLGDLVAEALGAVAVEGAQVDVDER